MTHRRRATPARPTRTAPAVHRRHAVVLLLAVVLAVGLAGGCTGEGGAVAGGAEVSLPPAGPAVAAAPASSPARPPARGRPRTPVVPQYRATLPPAAPERPAPVRFAAPSIGVDLPVVRTGVADDGRMQLPETAREVAWYAFGSRPGDRVGTTVLAAHVDTRREGLGPFARLRELRRGAALLVTDSTGRTRRYTVTSVDEVRKSQVSVDDLFRRDGPPELTVLTCGGPFNRRTGYRDNIVVTARPR